MSNILPACGCYRDPKDWKCPEMARLFEVWKAIPDTASPEWKAAGAAVSAHIEAVNVKINVRTLLAEVVRLEAELALAQEKLNKRQKSPTRAGKG